MDLTGINEPKLKQLVIEKWKSAPELWPVKVMSLARAGEIAKQNGGTFTQVQGYFTCCRAVRFKTPSEMEDILGLAHGTFSSGVSVLKFVSLPAPEQFELRGYTQLPGGRPFDGIVVRSSEAQRPQFFERNGAPSKFPPGLAVEQWELRVPLPAVQLQAVPPGQTFTKWQ